MIGDCHRFLSQDSSAVKLITWLQIITSVFGSGWRNAELASWIFHNYIFLRLNYPPGGRQGFGITHSAFHQAVRYRAGRSDSKARSLRHQGETARHNLEAAGHWGNELTPCDPLLRGFSGLETDNMNVYSKLFPGKKYKNKILPKSHILICFCFTLFIPSDGKFLHRTEKCIYLSKNSGWRCSSPPLNWPCLSLVGRLNLSLSYNDQARVTLL